MTKYIKQLGEDEISVIKEALRRYIEDSAEMIQQCENGYLDDCIPEEDIKHDKKIAESAEAYFNRLKIVK